MRLRIGAMMAAFDDPHCRIAIALGEPFNATAVQTALSAFEPEPVPLSSRAVNFLRFIWARGGDPSTVPVPLPSGRWIAADFA